MIDDRDPDVPAGGRRFLPSGAGRWALVGVGGLALILLGLRLLGAL